MKSAAAALASRLAAVALALSLAATPAGASELAAKVLKVSGKVEARAAAGEWRDVAANQTLRPGDEIRTGENAHCLIGFYKSQASAIRLEPGTENRLVSVDPPKIELISGKLFALADKLKGGSSFEVRTPVAIASVRGTGWTQTADEVRVFDDVVRVETLAGSSADVSNGQGVRIEGGAIGAPSSVSASERADYEAFQAEAKRLLRFDSSGEDSLEEDIEKAFEWKEFERETGDFPDRDDAPSTGGGSGPNEP